MNTRNLLFYFGILTISFSTTYNNAKEETRFKKSLKEKKEALKVKRSATLSSQEKKQPKKKEPVLILEKEKPSLDLNKYFKDMNYEELKEKRKEYIEANNMSIIIKYTERMLTLCQDVHAIANHLLELADAYFNDGSLLKAEAVYRQFVHLYGGSKKVEYATYKAVLCSFNRTLTHDRDQSKTESTIELCDEFLARDVFTQYKDQVIAIRKDCYQKLADNEFYIVDFYMHPARQNKKAALTAAQRRLKVLREEWLPKLPEIEMQLVAMEQRAGVIHSNEQAAQELVEAFIEAETTINTTQHFANRF